MARDLSRLSLAALDSLIEQQATSDSCSLYAAVEDDLGDLSSYPDRWGACFWPHFSGFALDYLHYRRFLTAQDLAVPVIDLGCSHGFASSLFLSDGYLGIDQQLTLNVNAHHSRVRYQQADANEIPLADEVVISNMSLGFFGHGPLGVTEPMLEELAKARVLMMAAPLPLIEALLPAFPRHTWLAHSEHDALHEAASSPGKQIAMPKSTTGRIIFYR